MHWFGSDAHSDRRRPVHLMAASENPGPPDALSQALAAVGRRDKSALNRVIAACGGQLFALCLRITQDRSAAEDVFQETIIKVWNRAAGFDPDRNSAMAWLSTIARNSAIDWYRSNARHSFVNEDAIPVIKDEAEPVPDRIIREERENRAIRMLSELPEGQEMEVRSIYFDGISYPELAEREGVPLATMKSRVRRALLTMRRTFEDD